MACRKKTQLLALGAVALILVLAVALKAGRPGHKPTGGGAVTPVALPQKRELSPERRTSSFTEWGRDPFSVGSAAELGGDLILSGIVWDEKKPYCIINGTIVKAGGEVSGHKVLEIKKDSIVVKVGDELRVLRLGEKR